MVKDCPVCGREFIVSWPGQWSYKEGGVYICSWGCLQKQRKEAEEMGRPRKNGTPAEKPVKREGVELVHDTSIAEEYRREQAKKEAERKAREAAMRDAVESQETEKDDRDLWQTAAVRNSRMGTFYYDEKFKTVDWRSPFGEEISLPPEDWKWLADHIGMILHALGVDE